MAVHGYRSGRWKVLSRQGRQASDGLLDAVTEERLVRQAVFRDNWRTLSANVDVNGESLLLKIPRARNARWWERFLTIFRGSDALRSFRHLEKMAALGVPAPSPVIAGELHKWGVVIDSFICYRFVEARRAGPGDAEAVLDALRNLHEFGYLRTDAQLANFLIREGTVVFIDFRLKKPRLLPQLRKAQELDRFLRSCPEASRFLTPEEASSFWLRIAHGLENVAFVRRNAKRRLRDRKKSKRSGAPRR